MERKGDWIATYSGIKFWPLDPRTEEIDIGDIAHALSHVCRFGGHCHKFYSVGQHSWLCSYNVKPKYALYALLHDAPEAYISDICRPIKRFITNFQEIEDNLMRVIAEKYNFVIDGEAHEEIKRVDGVALFTEARDLITDGGLNWKGQIKPLDTKIVPWSSELTKDMFLNRFKELYGIC